MHVTAKPSSFQCNLKCDYCFYLEKESQFTHEKWMDDSTLKEFIKQYIAASGNQVYFTWQGGEPTLAGLDFFRKVIHYQQRYAGQKRIFNALQTNGILLNNEWCAFLKEHEFLVGISIDGPQELHDRYRRSNSGNGTFAKVIAAIERLKSYQIAQFTAADALAADRQLFSSPADITFVIVGNVAEDKLVALITRYLGSIKHSDSPLAAGKPLTRATDNASVTVKEQNEPVAQVSQWKRYNSRTPVNLATRMALDAFNVALAKDLRINIREQASGAYSVSSRLSVDPQAKDISHLLAFTCQPERHDELLTLANEVMVKRLAKGISEQELNEYQQNVQRSLDIQQRSVQQLANTIVNSLIQYDDPAAWTEQEQLLKQMTVENVNTAVKQYLSHPVNTYTGVLLPK